MARDAYPIPTYPIVLYNSKEGSREAKGVERERKEEGKQVES